MDYLCKLVGTTQASCVFFSSFSILLIAVDRYMFIVHPTATQISTKQVAGKVTQFLFNCCFPGIPFVLRNSLHLCLSLLTTVFPDKAWREENSDGRDVLLLLRGKNDKLIKPQLWGCPHYRAGSLHTAGLSTPWSALSSSTWCPVWWLGLSTPSKYNTTSIFTSQIKAAEMSKSICNQFWFVKLFSCLWSDNFNLQ